MQIGTLSFGFSEVTDPQTRNKSIKFDLGARRRDVIERIAKFANVDLLVCAGWSVDGRGDVNLLAKRLSDWRCQTAILLEAQHDEFPDPAAAILKLDDQVLHWIAPGGGTRALGRQFFGQGNQLDGRQGPQRLRAFEQALPGKSVGFGDYSVLTLDCGEMNILKLSRPGNIIHSRSDCASAMFDKADIIINPTHDWMRRYEMRQKRQFLSHFNGSRKLVISVSNWNRSKKQKPTYSSIHAIYLGGNEVACSQTEGCDEQGYLYRGWEVEF